MPSARGETACWRRDAWPPSARRNGWIAATATGLAIGLPLAWPINPAEATDAQTADAADHQPRSLPATIVGSFDVSPRRMVSQTELLVRRRSVASDDPTLGFHRLPVPPGQSPERHARFVAATGLYDIVMPHMIVLPADDPSGDPIDDPIDEGTESDGDDQDDNPLGGTNDPQRLSQWYLDTIRADRAWNAGVGSPTVTIAFVDTGVDLDHPDLIGRLVDGFNVVNGFPMPQASGGMVDDVSGHGTVTAGVAAASTDNAVGIAGVGFDLSIMPIRVSNFANGAASIEDVLLGITVAASVGADIICVGYEGVEQPGAQVAGAFAAARGALVVWPTGNAGRKVVFDHPDVLVVGGTNASDNVYTQSNYGPGVDVAAPAWRIRSTRRGGTYGDQSGTSYAGPVAAGVAGLLYSIDPAMTPDRATELIAASAIDLTTPGRDDRTGAGRIDASTALGMATGLIAEPCVLPAGTDDNSALPPTPQRLEPLDGAWFRWVDRLPSENMADLDSEPAIRTDINGAFVPGAIAAPPDAVGLVVSGLIEIPATSRYHFGVDTLRPANAKGPSPVGVRMTVAGRCVADHLPSEGGPAGGSVVLDQGLHPIVVSIADPSGVFAFDVLMGPSGSELEPIGTASRAPHPVDLNRDDSLTGSDFFAFLDLFASGSLVVDYDNDGKLLGADFFRFLDLFSAGV